MKVNAKLGIAGFLAIALMVGRCSPLSPSIQKGSGKGGNGGRPPFSHSGVDSSQPVSFQTRVVDGETYSILVGSRPATQKVITLSPTEYPELFSQFLRTGRADLGIDGLDPESVTGLFEVTLSAGEIQAQELGTFVGAFKAIAEGTAWELSVSSSTREDVWATVRDHLVGITLLITDASGTGGLTPVRPQGQGQSSTSGQLIVRPIIDEPAPTPAPAPAVVVTPTAAPEVTPTATPTVSPSVLPSVTPTPAPTPGASATPQPSATPT